MVARLPYFFKYSIYEKVFQIDVFHRNSYNLLYGHNKMRA
jgi:hypothetical protein